MVLISSLQRPSRAFQSTAQSRQLRASSRAQGVQALLAMFRVPSSLAAPVAV